MSPIQAWTLYRLQQQPKNWPGHTNVSEYCIYLGSSEVFDDKVDFYHYEPNYELYYSTAIVFGNNPDDYMSGWPELATKHDLYREQMRREFKCGFLTLDDLARIGMAALGIERSASDTIRPMRGNFRLGPDMDIDENKDDESNPLERNQTWVRY